MPGGKEVRAGKAFVELVLRDKLQAGLRRAASRLRAFAGIASSIGAGLTAASATILGPLTAAVQHFSNVGDAVHKMAARTGLSAEAVSELGHAAELSGTSLQSLESGVRRMQKTIGDATAGLGSAKDALSRLGLSANDLVGLSPEEQLAIFADKLSAIDDPALRAAAAMDVFGRAGTQLLPMFAGGSAGLQEMRDQARALGLTISTDTANSAAALTDALGTMWSSVKALTLNIGGALAPILTEAANRISAAVAAVTKFVQRNQQLVVIVAGVAAGVAVVGTALLSIGGLAAVAALALTGLASVIGFIGTVISGIGTVIGTILTPVGLLVAAVVAAAGAWLYFSGTGGEAIAWLKERFGELVSFIGRVAGGIGNALAAGDLELAVRILWAAIRVAFFQGVQELANIWTNVSAAAGRAWRSIQQSAQQAIGWISARLQSVPQVVTDALGAVTSVLTPIFQSYMQAGTSLTSGLASGFVSLRNSAVESISAIATALSAGDFALAGEIAWTSIQLAFAQGIAWVTDAWTEFTTGLATIFDGLVTRIRQVWTDAISFIAKAIVTLVASIRSALDVLEETDPSGIAGKLKARLNIDVEGAIGALEEDRRRTNRGLENARGERDQQRAEQMARQLAETEKRLAELRAARQAALAKAGALDDGTAESPLAKAMADLEQALAEAASAPKLFDPKAAAEDLGDVGGLGDARQVAAQGTFNAAAIRGLGANSLAQRTAQAVEKVADNTGKLVREAQHGGITFA